MTEPAALALELCGCLADRAGPWTDLDIPRQGCTAAEVLARAGAQLDLADEIASGRIRLCINEVMATPNTLVAPGDRVALFPPVSGG